MFLLAYSAAFVLWVASVAQDVYAFTRPEGVVPERIWLLDVDVEGGMFTWVSILAFFTASILLMYTGRYVEDLRWRRLFWYFLAFLFLILSLDDHSAIHEKASGVIGGYTGTEGVFAFAWAVPAGLLAIAGLIAFLPFLHSLPDRIGNLMTVAAIVFLTGAVGLEIVGGQLAAEHGIMSPQYRLEVNLEEMLEFSGVMLFIYAILLFVDAKHDAGGGGARPERGEAAGLRRRAANRGGRGPGGQAAAGA